VSLKQSRINSSTGSLPLLLFKWIILHTWQISLKMHFIIKALDAGKFSAYFRMDEAALSKSAARKMIVDEKPGFPCRISLQDAEIGEEVILINYMHHDVDSPYRASGPVFIRNHVPTAVLEVNEIPLMLRHRLLSLRGYDNNGMMLNASVTEGKDLKDTLISFFKDDAIRYVHIHNARPGCYNCVAERV
jgi:hypothetical protein